KRRKPLIRHDALQPLSRHHMIALHLSLKMRRAATDKEMLPMKALIEEIEDFWKPDGLIHFREEEEILLTAYAQHVAVEDIPEIQEMLIEHVKIRALFETILTADDPSLHTIHSLGEQLEKHVRKEERVIFPMIEKALPEDVLQEVKPYLH
ncbi:MAG TPA: hemerythrin domain-containing protein, partial [Bacillota bacterium]|nr:hemerythrin domain-containing protein [Bacillota bacterium]